MKKPSSDFVNTSKKEREDDMKKIKPLRKKHRFTRWLKRLLGIQSPSARACGFRDIDEMHDYQAPMLTGALKSGTATVTFQRQKKAQWIEGDYGESLKLACSSCGSPFEYRTSYCPDCGAKMEDEL